MLLSLAYLVMAGWHRLPILEFARSSKSRLRRRPHYPGRVGPSHLRSKSGSTLRSVWESRSV